MEFVEASEVMALLKDCGIVPESSGEDRVYLRHGEGGDVVRLHLAAPEATIEPHEGARVVGLEEERLPSMIDGIIHKLRLSQILLMPVGKWRSVFDAVAFSLADNEDWQEIDTTATVELNGRDPLLCEPGDFQTVSALIKALLSDAETPEQGLMLTSTSSPLLVEIVPNGAVRVSFGNQVLADEVLEVFES